MSRRVLRPRTGAALIVQWTALQLSVLPSSDLHSAQDSPPPSIATDSAPQATATANESAAAVEQEYIGTNQCFQCHRPQTNSWSDTNHAQAFTILPEKYRSDVMCLKCHVTGFGQANGFVAGTEKDLSMVGCESCHGPGAKHVDAAKRFVLATPDEEAQIQQEMKETIIRTPTDAVCAGCHTTQAHGTHPEFGETLPGPRGASAAAASGSLVECNALPLAVRTTGSTSARTRYSPGYSVKTCGSCHYDQYQHARTDRHFALSASLPPKYMDNQDCHQCHTKSDLPTARLVSSGLTLQKQVGVACESCHGPALEHVRFNVRFIHGPPLGRELEQAARDSIRKGKSETSCIECHVGESHKEHPEFEI